MAEFTILDGDTVAVSYQPSTLVAVEVLDPPTVGVVTVQGPQGPQGPAGPAFTGVAWFYGSGPPVGIIGSKVGDKYLDVEDGTIYTLGD